MNNAFNDFKVCFEENEKNWSSEILETQVYECGYCGCRVSSNEGMGLTADTDEMTAGVYICNNCHLPTLIYKGELSYPFIPFPEKIHAQIPGTRFGEQIKYLPDKVENIYEEARDSFSVGAYTAVMLLCRKLLMHVAVDLGADKNKKFIDYIDYFEKEGYISKNARSWVDKIRKLGNEANHEIMIGNKEDAKKIIEFSAMLLKTNYEYPKEIED
ncbi:MAG: hypothetical protein [Caudoviricetes sp.]|nr:MAG: hypothetical protein [Caudoviricetes sp.]